MLIVLYVHSKRERSNIICIFLRTASGIDAFIKAFTCSVQQLVILSCCFLFSLRDYEKQPDGEGWASRDQATWCSGIALQQLTFFADDWKA